MYWLKKEGVGAGVQLLNTLCIVTLVCVCVSSEQRQTDQQSQFNEPSLMGASANIKHAAQTV